MASQQLEITIEDLVDAEQPQDARFSPSADQIVYSTSPRGKKGEHEVSTLWIASTGEATSARPLTSGFYNDRSPQWNPNGDVIAFISDRFERGETCAIYALPIHGGEPYPLTRPENKRDISQFQWSPDGLFIAYLSADEKTTEQEAKEKDKDDVKVYGESWEYNRLRLVNVSTRQSSTIYQTDAHVKELAWHETSKTIAIATQQTPDINSPIYHGTDIGTASLSDSKFSLVYHLSGNLASLQIFNSVIYFTSQVKLGSEASATTIYSLRDGKLKRERYGTEDDAENIVAKRSFLAIKVLSGLWDQIHLLDGNILYSVPHEIFPGSWDIVETSPGVYSVAFAGSTASTPREMYSVADLNGDGRNVNAPVQLSNHGEQIRKGLNINTTFISRISADANWTLDGLYHAPLKAGKGPLPTVVLIHGGPYSRWTDRFDSLSLWVPTILKTGRYGVLVPNYRGGSSHGDEFAAQARGRMGTEEYDDVLTLVDEGIERGFVDKTRILVGGWSQGGFLSYMCAVRNGFDHKGNAKSWSFKGAMPGAGVTDWDMMCMTSDAPSFEGELAGGTPWTTKNKSDVSARKGSAIWEMAKPVSIANRPPVLILHGEADKRVPVTQAIAFHRGCLESGGLCEMAIYPREPHDLQERRHIIDMLNRVIRFCDVHIG